MLLLFVLAVAPGLAIMLYIYRKDQYQHEPWSLLLKCFIAGALSTIPAALLEDYGGSFGLDKSKGDADIFIYAFFVVALAEEGCKYLLTYRFAYRNPHFDEPFDGIVYTVMVGMGFATLENLLYVYTHGMGTAIMRMFTAVPAHATFAIIMGYYLGKAKFNPEKRFQYKLYAIGGAVFFHGVYDYSLFESQNYPLAAFGALVSLFVAIRLSRRAIQLSSDSSPFKVVAVTHDTNVVITDADVTVTQHDSVVITTNNDPATHYNDPKP